MTHPPPSKKKKKKDNSRIKGDENKFNCNKGDYHGLEQAKATGETADGTQLK